MAFKTELTNAKEIIQNEFRNELLKIIPSQSTLLSMCSRRPDFKGTTIEMPVTTGLVDIDFVDSAEEKPVTKAEFGKLKYRRHEMAGITVFTDKDIEDAQNNGVSMIQYVKDQFREVAKRKMEEAILFSSALPDTLSVMQSATRASNILTKTADLYEDILGEDGIQALVEADGYEPTAFAGGTKAKAILRGLRDATGRPLFSASMRGDVQPIAPYGLDNLPLMIQPQSFWNPDALLIVGDFKKIIYSMGDNFTFDISNEATINMNGEQINLFQRDMTALRFYFSFGFLVPSLINYDNNGKAVETLSPFAVLKAS